MKAHETMTKNEKNSTESYRFSKANIFVSEVSSQKRAKIHKRDVGSIQGEREIAVVKKVPGEIEDEQSAHPVI